jgi:hypothetical protein
MPLSFPQNPAPGQTYTSGPYSWQFDGERWRSFAGGATGATGPAGTSANIAVYDEGNLVVGVVNAINFVGPGITANLVAGNVEVTVTATGTGTGGFTFGNTPPITAQVGDRWLSSENLVEYIYINDGNSSQWVESVSYAVPATGAANISVYDENSLVTGAVTGLRFTGPGVTANLVAGNVEVTVSATGSGTGGATVSDTTPATTTEGSLWMDSETGEFRVYFANSWATVGSGPIGATGPVGPAGATGAGANLIAVASNIVPAANVTYDLGTSTNRWRDLYLSGNTIDLGGTAIKSSAAGVSFTSAANAAVTVPLTVSAIQISSAGNVITLQATATGLQTVRSDGNIAALGNGGATVTVGNTAPVSPTEGALWLHNETGKLRIYYSGAWAGVAVGPVGATGIAGNIGPQGATGPAGSPGAAGAGYDVTTNSTGYLALSAGTTAQRPVTPPAGAIRYNSTTGFAEVYTAAGWGIFGAQPPTISSVTPASYNGEQGTQFTINGTNFTSDASVFFITNGGAEYIASTVIFVGASQLVAATPRDFAVADEPLDVKVVQGSGVVTKLDVIDCGGVPTWVTASGTVATINDKFGNYSPITTLVASDPDAGSTITYAVTSGSLPLGTNLNASTGAISGDPTDVTAQTTSNFTVTATDNAGNQTSRAFNIIVNPVLAVEFLAAGGGAGGAGDGGGGGGAGGFLTLTATILLGATSNVSIGAGGGGGGNGSNTSVFGYTLLGGGTGGRPGQNGGSGGGGNMFYSYSFCPGGSSIQNSTFGYGLGNGGGNGNTANTQSYGYGGGGGGANGVGTAATNGGAGAGGSAIASTISGSSVSYCGGGGGGGLNGGAAVGGGGGAGNGAGGSNAVGGSASANTGSGGGGGGGNSAPGGGGGSGIVILKYLSNYNSTFSVGLTVSTANTGGYKISTITGGTGTVSFALA